jgi:N-acyl-D-aspartate/D-glutamate deacylase
VVFDLVVRGGLVVDGSGLPAFLADVGVVDGRVVRVGRIDASVGADRALDATGRVVAPGFIDIHTHFDAQLSWDAYATPMIEHGVTTIVTGNCSLSLAPLHEHQRARLARMFGQIEQLPQVLFDVGVDWSWESFAEWIDVRRPGLGVNLAPLVGHSALRMYVMGDDAHERAATDREILAMQAELERALAAGAVGLSVSCVDVDERGRPVPSRLAERTEIERLCDTLGDAGAMLQIVPEFWDAELMCRRIDELANLSIRCKIPTTFSPLIDQTPGLVERVLTHLDTATARGARVFAQVQPRGLDVNFRLCEWNFALYRRSGWSRILRMTDREEQLACYRDRETRERLVATAYPDDDETARAQLDSAYVSAVVDDSLAPVVGRSLAELARERGCNAAEAMIDIAVADGLETRFTKPPTSNQNHALLTRMLQHPSVLVGASDAGAHVRGFSTYGDTAVVFADFVRDGGPFRVEDAVKRLTSDLAVAWNLPDRGLLRPGGAADLVVFDPATIARGAERDVADMPTGCARYVRGSQGVDATVINGVVAWTSTAGYEPSLSGTIASNRPR